MVLPTVACYVPWFPMGAGWRTARGASRRSCPLRPDALDFLEPGAALPANVVVRTFVPPLGDPGLGAAVTGRCQVVVLVIS